jgi:dynein heavy chain, axonemal
MSRYVGIYLVQVERWTRTLSDMSDVLKLWMNVQQKWIYLENIFLTSNVQFDDESKRFERVDKFYRRLMLGKQIERRTMFESIVTITTHRF